MNQEKRKRIQKVIDQLGDLKSEIEEIESEERTAFDNLSEGLQAAANGQKLEECADKLSDAMDEFDTVISSLEETVQ